MKESTRDMESEPRASATAKTKRRRVQRRHKEISPRSLSPRLPRTPVRCCRCRGLPANPKTLKQNSFSPFTHRRVLIDPHHTIHVHTQIGSNEPVSYESRSHLNGFLSWIFPLLGSFLPKSQSVFSGPFCSIHLVPTFIHLFFIPFNLPTLHQPRFHPSGLHYRLFSFSFSFYFSSKTFFIFLFFSFPLELHSFLIYNFVMGPQQFIPHPNKFVPFKTTFLPLLELSVKPHDWGFRVKNYNLCGLYFSPNKP